MLLCGFLGEFYIGDERAGRKSTALALRRVEHIRSWAGLSRGLL